MRGEDGALSSEWCAILAAKLSRGKSLLLLCFKKGWLQRQNSGKKAAIPFRAKAYCTFSCCGIHCELHITKDDNDGGDSDVKLHVSQSGTVQHRGDERKPGALKVCKERSCEVNCCSITVRIRHFIMSPCTSCLWNTRWNWADQSSLAENFQ